MSKFGLVFGATHFIPGSVCKSTIDGLSYGTDGACGVPVHTMGISFFLAARTKGTSGIALTSPDTQPLQGVTDPALLIGCVPSVALKGTSVRSVISTLETTVPGLSALQTLSCPAPSGAFPHELTPRRSKVYRTLFCGLWSCNLNVTMSPLTTLKPSRP